MDTCGERPGRIGDSGDFGAVRSGRNDECRQPPIDTDPTRPIRFTKCRVVKVGMQVSGLDGQTDPPSPGAVAEGGKQYFGALLGNHPPQTSSVVKHCDRSDAGQDDRARPIAFSDANQRTTTRRPLVAEPERPHSRGLAFESRKPNPPTSSLTGPGGGPSCERTTTVDGGFFENLLADLVAPCQPRHHHLGNALSIDGEDPTRVHTLFPFVEFVDQVEPGPRHNNFRVGRALRKGRLHHL